MGQKLLEQKNGAEEAIVCAEAVCPKMTIAELAKKIEAGVIDSKTLGKKTIRQLTVYYKNRGYSIEEINECLKVSFRTILRYIKKARSESAIEFGIDFQKNFIQDFMNNTNAHYQSILRLLHGDDLTSYEKSKRHSDLIKMDLARMAFLEKLGYLSKENAAIINGIDASEYVSRNSGEWRLLQRIAKTGSHNRGEIRAGAQRAY